jgi:hypothetical protein
VRPQVSVLVRSLIATVKGLPSKYRDLPGSRFSPWSTAAGRRMLALDGRIGRSGVRGSLWRRSLGSGLILAKRPGKDAFVKTEWSVC